MVELKGVLLACLLPGERRLSTRRKRGEKRNISFSAIPSIPYYIILKYIITIQFNPLIPQSSNISSLYLRSVGLPAIGRPLMKRFLLMCCVQSLVFFILERLTTSKEWHTQ